MRISALSDEDLRREMREHTAAIPAARRMFGLNASERGSEPKNFRLSTNVNIAMRPMCPRTGMTRL